MQKVTLSLALLASFLPQFLTAQTSCASPEAVTFSTYSVDSIYGEGLTDNCNITPAGNKANWYLFTSESNVGVRVTSNLIDGGDTRLSVFVGDDCDNLLCVSANDDVDGGLQSRISFNAMAGENYYITWDNRWANTPFEFTLTEVIIPVTEISFATSNTTNSGTTIAVVDMNGDYLDDIVGIGNEQVYVNRQNEDGTFEQYEMPTEGPMANGPDWSLAAGDYDGNGYNDLVIGGGSAVSFLRANDDGTAMTEIAYEEYVFSQRTNFVDINNDGNLDAFVCHDVAPNVYYLNDGENNLEFYQGSLGDSEAGGNYGSIWIDFDNDGDLDLFIAKCRGGSNTININQLHQNNGDGTYTEVAEQYNLADPTQTWSSAWGDYDNDGDLDLFVGASSFSDGRHKLMRNDGNTFTDITEGSGLDTLLANNVETVTHDFNNDGYLDLLNGGRVLMLNNGDFTFRPSSITPGHGAIGDLNNDGFVDVVNGNTIYFNQPNNNNHLTVRTVGTISNLNGIGARIEVYSALGRQIREIRSGTGFRYMSSLNAYFGLGADTQIDKVIVRWPSGIVDEVLAPAINAPLTVVEGNFPSLTRDLPIETLSFYPNPVQDQVNLKGQWSNELIANIYDLQGRLLLSNNIQDNRVDVKTLTPGSYLLILEGEDRIHLARMIKQ